MRGTARVANASAVRIAWIESDAAPHAPRERERGLEPFSLVRLGSPGAEQLGWDIAALCQLVAHRAQSDEVRGV